MEATPSGQTCLKTFVEHRIPKNYISTSSVIVDCPQIAKIELKPLKKYSKWFNLEYPKGPFRSPLCIVVRCNPSVEGQEIPKVFKTTWIVTNETNKEAATKEKYELVIQFNMIDETKKQNDNLICVVCTSHFSGERGQNTPLVLPACGHSICSPCAARIQRPVEGRDRYEIPCTECREISTSRKIKKEDKDKFPVNYKICELVSDMACWEMKATMDTPDPYVPCYENSRHESTVYCKDCGEAFCDFCFNKSHSSKIHSGHTTIPVLEKPIVFPMCPNHPEKQAQYMCKKPLCKNVLLCPACFKNNHYGHPSQCVPKMIKKNTGMLEESLQRLIKASWVLKYNQDIANFRIAKFSQNNLTLMKSKLDEEINRLSEIAHCKLEAYYNMESNKAGRRKEQLKHDLRLVEVIKKSTDQVLRRKTDLHVDHGLVEKANTVRALGQDLDYDFYGPPDDFCITELLDFTCFGKHLSPNSAGETASTSTGGAKGPSTSTEDEAEDEEYEDEDEEEYTLDEDEEEEGVTQ